jgi:hypothetical protein
MDPPPDYSASNAPINVLVVGETQQGKSTLIKRITKYAGAPKHDIKVGDGNSSCTKSVTGYLVTVAPKEYRLVDSDGNPLTDLPYDKLRDLDDEEASVSEFAEEISTPITFNFIDTPGLNDSDGDDINNMAHIVGHCSGLKHINALLYVRSYHEPYSRAFRQFFDYLQRCLPDINRGFIVLHTRFAAERIKGDINDAAQLRREDFSATTNLSLEHFFLDSLPDRESPFAQLQSLNETYRLLQHLASQRANPSRGFRLVKTPQMQNIDIHIRNALNELKLRLERDRQAQGAVSDTFRYNGMIHQTEISRLGIRIATIKSQIENLLNGPDVVLGTKGCAVDYTFSMIFTRRQMTLDAQALQFQAEYDITSVEKTQASGVRWQNEILRGNTWRAEVSGASFRSLSATATFYTTSAIRNRVVIDVLKSMVIELEDAAMMHRNAITMREAGAQYDEAAAKLGQELGKVDEMLTTLAKDEFEIALWPLLRKFYGCRAPLSRYQIREFVQVYDEEVAQLLPL